MIWQKTLTLCNLHVTSVRQFKAFLGISRQGRRLLRKPTTIQPSITNKTRKSYTLGTTLGLVQYIHKYRHSTSAGPLGDAFEGRLARRLTYSIKTMCVCVCVRCVWVCVARCVTHTHTFAFWLWLKMTNAVGVSVGGYVCVFGCVCICLPFAVDIVLVIGLGQF